MAHNIDQTDRNLSSIPLEKDEKYHPSWIAVATGLNVAIFISYLFCKPPQDHTLSLKSRLLASIGFLLVTSLAGTLGTWIALPRDSSTQFRRLLLWQARCWIFLPAIMILLRRNSILALALAALSATLMAVSFLRFRDPTLHPFSGEPLPDPDAEKKIFTTQVQISPSSWLPFGISLCLYGALISAANEDLGQGTLLIAAATFLFIVRANIVAQKPIQTQRKTSQPYAWLAVALFCTFVALSVPGQHFVPRIRTWNIQERATANPKPIKPSPDSSSAGYRTIILWPIQKKEKVLPFLPASIISTSHRPTRPWTIPFYGPYLYFKSSDEIDGPKTRKAEGDPMKVNVRSTDHYPLLMEARQNLSDPIEMNCCREIQVVFRDDTTWGTSEVGISLTDTRSKEKLSQNLGIKYVSLDRVVPHLGESTSIEATLTFPFPPHTKLKQFDQITVTLFPDPKHLTAGRRVAIERFVMIPN